MTRRFERGSGPMGLGSGGFIERVQLNRDRVGRPGDFPWCLPAVKGLSRLDLHPKVTFLVGENGTGKSTLIEALAQCAGFELQGGSNQMNLASEEEWSPLARALKLARGRRREKDGFFLRAESFYNVATRLEDSGVNMKWYGGRSPHEQSHGESFLALAANRWAGEGLYILDEPEAALSPSRQLAFLRILHAQVAELGSQFVIATHSPILMAYPEARLYELDENGIREGSYEETEHYRLTRDFLSSPGSYLRALMGDL